MFNNAVHVPASTNDTRVTCFSFEPLSELTFATAIAAPPACAADLRQAQGRRGPFQSPRPGILLHGRISINRMGLYSAEPSPLSSHVKCFPLASI
jgi:hypothetical protein